jgi:hypothetical protein
MIIAFIDDGTVEVCDDLAEAQREHEGIDVENGVVEFYSEDGSWLEPIFVEPNRRGTLPFGVGWVESGSFRLEPRPDRLDRPIWRAFARHRYAGKLGAFSSIADLQAHLAAGGVQVKPPDGWVDEDAAGSA